jgi:hypothetical protein
MSKLSCLCVLALGLTLIGGIFSRVACAEPAGTLLAHNVYFSLNDNSEAAKDKLVAACKKYLSGHPGTIFYAAGVMAREFDRPVNDRDFDVSLHVVFDSKAAHDRYLKDARHLKFIEENNANWKKVRVFDSYVEK